MSGQTIAEKDSATGVVPTPVASAPWRVRAVSVLPNHRLAVTFIDGAHGTVDCSAILTADSPGIYAPLANLTFFGNVSVELGVPTWHNGADLDPAWLYDNLSTGKTWSDPEVSPRIMMQQQREDTQPWPVHASGVNSPRGSRFFASRQEKRSHVSP